MFAAHALGLALQAAPAARPCADFARGAQYLEIAPRPARPGMTLRVRARRVDGPFGTDDIPRGCLSGWTVGGAPGATLSAEGDLLLPPDLPAGTRLTVEARLGDLPVRGEARLIGRDEPSVIGAWSQVNGAACRAGEASWAGEVGELLFTDRGDYAVTFAPFEQYYDYGGRYLFDPKSGRLDLTVTDGSNRPAWTRLSLKAKAAPGRLTLTPGLPRFGLHGPGDPPPGARPQACAMVFELRPGR